MIPSMASQPEPIGATALAAAAAAAAQALADVARASGEAGMAAQAELLRLRVAGAARINALRYPRALAAQETTAALPDWLSLDRHRANLIDYGVFASIYNAGKLALFASWRDRPSTEKFSPPAFAGLRHRVVRVVRDYGMFDRRESPQYYPDIQTGTESRSGS